MENMYRITHCPSMESKFGEFFSGNYVAKSFDTNIPPSISRLMGCVMLLGEYSETGVASSAMVRYVQPRCFQTLYVFFRIINFSPVVFSDVLVRLAFNKSIEYVSYLLW